MAEQGEERLQKVLAAAGIGSRRQCERFIAEGRIAVDGDVVTQMGVKVDAGRQRVTFDGRPIRLERKAYFLLNKPKDYVTTMAEDAGRRAVDLLKGVQLSLRPAGRLDKDSEGLIILTNDGELINLLTHPRHQVPKIYLVRVDGQLDSDDIAALQKGVFLAEGKARAGRITVRYSSRAQTIFEVELRQGMNRQIRRMLARIDHPVRQLRRVAIDGISDAKLKPGHFRRLTSTEVKQLFRAAARGEAAAERPRSTAAGARRR